MSHPIARRGTNGRLARTLWGLALALPTLAAQSQESYPSRPVTLQVGYGAGGTTDKVARLVALAMKETLGQSVVVENRPGAGGNLAAAAVAKSPPDGYTLYMATVSSHAIGPAMYQSLGFTPLGSFEPVALVAQYPLLVMASADFPAKTAAASLAYLKANPGKVFFGSAGVGSAGHLTGELLAARIGTTMNHVAYKGGSAASIAAMGGEISLMIDPLPGLLGNVRSGRLLPLAVSSSRRSTALPDVPTLAESGLAGFETNSWAGIVAPAGTPAAVVAKLQRAIDAALKSPAVAASLSADGVELTYLPGEPFRQFMASEMQRWGQVVKANRIKGE
ncbi:MAG: tripartite tricarboxylate transporter substrate binding protein [Proteobacteria bacterium]|nr:tripartite tricarboxylate transporter substrate binding protein [Pseudomonadota bacterium]